MAMFTEKGHGPGGAEAGLSIIGTGMRVVGDITAEAVVKVEGTVVGTVRAGRQVLVAKGGTVEGDVMAREAIIGGEVRGSIHADERVEIQTAALCTATSPPSDCWCRKAARSTGWCGWAKGPRRRSVGHGPQLTARQALRPHSETDDIHMRNGMWIT